MFYAEDKLPAQGFILNATYSKQCIPWHVSNIAFQILIQKCNLSHFSLCTQGAYKVCKKSLKTGGLWSQELLSVSEKEYRSTLVTAQGVPNWGMLALYGSQSDISSYARPDFPKPVQLGLLKCHESTFTAVI